MQILQDTKKSIHCEGFMDFPKIKKQDVPNLHKLQWFTFKDAKSHYARGLDHKQCGIHFYTDDKWFESVWSKPDLYIDFLRGFGAVCTPDFSMYTDSPRAVQVYNRYRSMRLGQYWKSKGIVVIPTVCWSDYDSYKWCFDGLPKRGIVSVSSVGVMAADEKTKDRFRQGCIEMMQRVKPDQIVWRGKVPTEFDWNIVKINDKGDLHFKQRHTKGRR